MKTRRAFLFSLLVFVPLGAAAQNEAVPVDTTAAVKAADEAALSWLHVIDEGKYTESWNQAAAMFKSAVTAEAWAQAVKQARGALEPFGARSLASSTYSTQFPNAPGQWVVLDYRTGTASGDVIERVSMRRESDGVWRAGGSFVRPV